MDALLLFISQDVKDYAGVIVGAFVLAASVFYLPARIRWYVAAAGISVLVFRTWQIFTNKKRLQEADAKWQELQDKQDEFKQEHEELRKELGVLRDKNQQIKQQRDDLKQQADDLNTNNQNDTEAFHEAATKVDKLQDEISKNASERDDLMSVINRKAAQNRSHNNKKTDLKSA